MKNTYTNYSLKMEYEPDGKILRKDVSASGNSMQTGYDNFYSYNTDQPHTISKLSDGQSFTWDKNGNMTEHFKSKHFVRYLAWDEENRLMGVADNNQVSFYLYDAAGERTVKFTGHNQWVDVNGIPQGYAGADKLTLYASPYLVATSGQYTKHYYAGEQRIVSKIGGGGLGNYNAGIIAPETHRKKVAILENMVRFIGNTLYLKTLSVKPKPSVPCNQEGMLVDLCNYRNIVHLEEDRYFYHPDHLGSSSWITDRDGMPMQHLAYLPFGEEFVDQKTSNWSAAYKFTGKEKDEETGYNYFGARYYMSDLGIWGSVDPLGNRHPDHSSYIYCANNPVILFDPDGRDWRQRQAAVNKAKEYVAKNPGNSYEWGQRGKPGEGVDCSGMVSNCIMSGGEPDPYIGQMGNGVSRIAQSSIKVENMDRVQPGNTITFDTSKDKNKPLSHIGMITDIIANDNGNTIGFKFIHSGGDPESGKSGPTYGTVMLGGNGYFDKRMTGVYKWDTIPDLTYEAERDMFNGGQLDPVKVTPIQEY